VEGSESLRHIGLQGCCNFRDLGGYPTIDGRHTRWRLLFRADGLTRLTAEDLDEVVALGVRNVLDLRTDLEVESRGRFDGGATGVEYHHLPLTDTLPGEEQGSAWQDTGFVAARYLDMLRNGTASVTRALALLAEPGGLPAVFHCSVGKDRTGVLAAVVLGLLGVPDAVIVDDYVLSATAMVRILERLRAEFPDADEVVDRYAPVILSVEAASMEGFLSGVHRHFGDFDGLAGALGVAAQVAALREILLQD